MSKLPVLSGKKLISALERAEFEVIRIKGSHHFFTPRRRKNNGHSGSRKRTIGIGLFHKILKDCELTKDEFQNLL